MMNQQKDKLINHIIKSSRVITTIIEADNKHTKSIAYNTIHKQIVVYISWRSQKKKKKFLSVSLSDAVQNM
jgi:hypothetical protein